jgi:glyoxylase-like metal-dependent hydrolase (beta-lactamase superfamily II)
MEIDCVVLGDFETNCYVLRSVARAKDCVIIDAGLGANELIEFLKRRQLNPVAVVLTHGHIDHIAGVAELRRLFQNTKLYVHRLDADMLGDSKMNLAAMMGTSLTTCGADVLLEDGVIIEAAELKLRVLHTPGHTPGGICLYCEADGVVFTDDALFAGSIGRTDFPGGDTAQLLKGIRQKLLSLPEDTVVHPGHGPQTTIAQEKQSNPFL